MKTIRHLLGAVVLACVPALAAQEAAEESALAAIPNEVSMLRFQDGSILWGQITGHDSERVTFQRLDTGGTARIPWARLDPVQSNELLERFGYVDDSGEELMIEADRLVLDDGSEIVGRIQSRTANEIYVKTANALIPVPKRRVRGAVGVVQRPALEVFTREELYQAEAANLAQADPRSHFELGQFCERIFDYAHALQHYEAAQALDPGFMTNELPQYIARSTEKAAQQEQLDKLYEIDTLRARRRFDEAMAECDVFEQLYPKSPLLDDLIVRRKRIEKSRDKEMAKLTARSFHKWARRLTEQLARQEAATFESSLEQVTENLTDQIFEAVHVELQKAVGESVTVDEVRRYWAERERERVYKASYGEATWLLGEGKARAGFPESETDEPKSEKDAERAKLEEKIKRFLANQQTVARAKSSGDAEDEIEKFWARWRAQNKGLFLLAYYVENSGQMHLRGDPLFKNCPDCNGTGVREIINTGSARSGSRGANTQTVECPLCHGIGIHRRIAYW